MKIDYLNDKFPKALRNKVFKIEEQIITKYTNIKSYNFIYDTIRKGFYLYITFDNELKFKFELTHLLVRKVDEIIFIINRFINQNFKNYERIKYYEKNYNLGKSN